MKQGGCEAERLGSSATGKLRNSKIEKQISRAARSQGSKETVWLTNREAEKQGNKEQGRKVAG